MSRTAPGREGGNHDQRRIPRRRLPDRRPAGATWDGSGAPRAMAGPRRREPTASGRVLPASHQWYDLTARISVTTQPPPAYSGPMTNQPEPAEKGGPCQIIKLDPDVSPCSELGVSVKDPLSGNTELLCRGSLGTSRGTREEQLNRQMLQPGDPYASAFVAEVGHCWPGSPRPRGSGRTLRPGDKPPRGGGTRRRMTAPTGGCGPVPSTSRDRWRSRRRAGGGRPASDCPARLNLGII